MIVRSSFPYFSPSRAFSLFFNAETNRPVNGSMLESERRQQPSLSFIPTQLHPYSPFNQPVNKIQATKPSPQLIQWQIEVKLESLTE